VEAAIARDRIQQQEALRALLTHAAIVDVLAGSGHLNDVLRKLRDE
jgi:hypothetical protein